MSESPSIFHFQYLSCLTKFRLDLCRLRGIDSFQRGQCDGSPNGVGLGLNGRNVVGRRSRLVLFPDLEEGSLSIRYRPSSVSPMIEGASGEVFVMISVLKDEFSSDIIFRARL